MHLSNLIATQHRTFKLPVPWATSPLFVVLVAGAAALLPAMIYGVPSNIDLFNHFRFALPFYDAIQQGRLHPGWLAESNFGFGDTSFRFYPPALYYLLALARALAGNWYVTTLSVLVILSMMGSVGVYLWAKEFLPSQAAMWAAVFYTIAPYHLNQLYQAFLLAEYAGAAVLPFTFLFVVRVCRRGSLTDVAGLSASYAVLILTHLPLTVIGSLALFVYALTCLEKRNWWSTVAKLTCGLFVGLLASSFYWVTMIAELKWIAAYDAHSTEYSQNFLFRTLSPENVNVWWMNIIVVATLAMFWPAFAILRKLRGADPRHRPVVVLMFLSVFMATPLSWPVWKLASPVQQVQFPWRWLTVTSMALSILLAASIPYWRNLAKGRTRSLVFIAAGTFAISVAFSLSHTVREAQYLNANAFDRTLRSIPGTQAVWQWWPIWAKAPIKKMEAPIDAGSRPVSVDSWEPERRVFRLAAGEPREVRVRTFFYPYWTATANGATLPITPDQYGAISMRVPSDAVSVTLEFKEPARVSLALVLSFIGWTMIAFVAVLGRLTRLLEPQNPSVATQIRTG